MITTINEFKDQLSGGLADNLNISDIAKKYKVSDSEINKQLELGIKVELEHTKDKQLAREIALDHLAEMPNYYTKLNTIEENVNESFQDKINNLFSNDTFRNLSTADTILSNNMEWKDKRRDEFWYKLVSLGINLCGGENVSDIYGVPEDFLLSVANYWAKDEKEGILKSIEKY